MALFSRYTGDVSALSLQRGLLGPWGCQKAVLTGRRLPGSYFFAFSVQGGVPFGVRSWIGHVEIEEDLTIELFKRKRGGKMEFDFGLQFAHFGADFEEPALEGIKLDLAPGGVL